MRTFPLAVVAASLLALACAGTTPAPAGLPAAEVARVAALVLPAEGEDAWRSLDWIPTYGDAVLEAERRDRPLLMWAMNGHPLGCT